MKKNVPTLVVGFGIGLALVLYTVAFQVHFDQAAVVTTFGKAGDGSVINADGQGAGFYWKWPRPVQNVIVYDTRVQVLDDRPEEQSTKDKQNLIVNAYVSWRIQDPLAFFQKLNNRHEAEKQLLSRLREAKSVLSRYNFDELANPNPEQLKLTQAEGEILARLQEQIGKDGYGIEVMAVGIKRLALPEPVTKSVFQRMRVTRQRLAEEARSSGKAIADKIEADAKSSSETILSFARRRAKAIRAEGDQAAAQHYATFKQNEDFAIFLRQIDALEKTLSHNTTFLLDTQVAPFQLLKDEAKPQESKPGTEQP